MLHKIFISIGANQGDRFLNIQSSINLLYEKVGNVLSISSVYETSSWGFESDDFLNCCVALTTYLSPTELLKEVKKIEVFLGRQAKTSIGYEARVIDIDILFYDNITFDEVDLTIPHVAITDRVFVLQPLADIAPGFIHPVTKNSVKELLTNCKDINSISLFDADLSNPFDKNYFTEFNFITIEGNIGVGKTSLVNMLSEDFNINPVFEEFEGNPFLEIFYKDKGSFSFPLEMKFLMDRYHQLSKLKKASNCFIADYHISKSKLFAKVNLSPDEFKLYESYFSMISNSLNKPNMYVYLYQNSNILLENIENRGRDYEKHISENYLNSIQQSYLSFIKSTTLKTKIIDVSNLDFVKNRKDYLSVLEKIKN